MVARDKDRAGVLEWVVVEDNKEAAGDVWEVINKGLGPAVIVFVLLVEQRFLMREECHVTI